MASATTLILLFVSVVFLVSITSATFGEPASQVWAVVQSNNPNNGKGRESNPCPEGLMQATDFRGDYQTFQLVVTNGKQIEQLHLQFEGVRFRPIAPASANDQLWVIECTAEQNLVAIDALQQADTFVYATLPNKIGGFSYVVKSEHRPLYQFDSITVIPVPTQEMVPVSTLEESPLSSIFRPGLKLERNEQIEKLINTVDRDNLVKNLKTLSDINSRLSISPTAVVAQHLIEDYYTDLGLDVKTYLFRTGWSQNVVAELPGSEDPTKVVVIGAHYDSRSTNMQDTNMRAPGADDNGSGTVAVMELARAFAASGLKFKYTIRFCSWSGEEQGLVGSRAYAQLMKANNISIIAALNADMIGWTNPRTGLLLALVTRLTTEWLTQAAREVSQLYLPDLPIGSTTACCSDQQSFLEQGYPAMGYFETTGASVTYPHYHRSTDLPQYLNPEQIELITKSAGALLATLAEPLES